MTVEVKALAGFGRDNQLRRTWLKIWQDLGERMLKLPKWMQDIVLEDIATAVKNRVAIMEMIQSASTKKAER